MSNKVAEVEVQAKANGLAAQLREIRAKFGVFADGVGAQMKKGFGKAFGAGKEKKGPQEGFLRGAGKTAVGNLISGGLSKAASEIGDVASSTLSFEDKLTRLQIQAGSTPQVMRAFANSVTDASNKTGIAREKILDGAAAYVTLTGDMNTARDEAFVFAKTAQATGSNVDDLAKTAAAAAQNLGVTGDQFEAMFSGMANQGKLGAVELKDFASELSSIAPQWAQFGGGRGLKGVQDLGAALQIVKRGFGGDASETVTGLNDLLTAVQKKGARFRALGIGSFQETDKSGVKHLKSVFDIVKMISESKAGKTNDSEALVKAFGSAEAYRAFIQLRDGKEDLQKFVEAGKDAGTVGRDFSTYMESSGGRMAQAFEKMKNAIATAFTPERITAFANAMENLADKVGPIADFLGKAADVLGGISGVGQSVRGLFGGNGNPYAEGATAEASLRLQSQYGSAAQRQQASEQLANAASYNTASGSILSGEKNDRTSEESIRRAALASTSSNSGEVTAGSRYLANVYGSGQEVSDAIDKVMRQEWDKTAAALLKGTGIGGNDAKLADLVGYLKQIATNTGAGTEVKVGADAVAHAAKNAPVHGRGVAK